MTAIDWWWTGQNNAADVDWGGYKCGYWPPRGVGIVRGIFYRVGWVCGKIAPLPRTP